MYIPGVVFALIGMVLWGFWAFFVKLALRDTSTEPVLLLSYVVATVVIGVYASIGLEESLGSLNLGVLGYTLAGGATAGLGTISYYVAIENGSVSTTTTVTGLYFVVAAALGMFLLGETISARRILGILFAIAAVVLIAG